MANKNGPGKEDVVRELRKAFDWRINGGMAAQGIEEAGEQWEQFRELDPQRRGRNDGYTDSFDIPNREPAGMGSYQLDFTKTRNGRAVSRRTLTVYPNRVYVL